MRIMTCTVKYDRTCQRSIEIISIEKTVALHKLVYLAAVFSGEERCVTILKTAARETIHKSAQKKNWNFFFLKKDLDELYLIT